MGIQAWFRSRRLAVGLMMALMAASPVMAVEVVTSPVALSSQAGCERAGSLKLVFGPEDVEAMYFRTTTSTHKSLSLRIGLSSGEVPVPMCSIMAGSTEGYDGDLFRWREDDNFNKLVPLDDIGVTVSSLSATGAPDIVAYAFGEKGAAYFDIYITSITAPADWSNPATRPWLMVGVGNGQASTSGDDDTDILVSPAAITASAPLSITVTEPEFDRVTATGDRILATSDTWNGAIPKSERDALEALYTDCGGTSWTRRDQWMGDPGSECAWHGVTCSDGRVSHLELEDNGLTGSLPTELAKLTSLKVLNFSRNGLSGDPTAILTQLTALTHLILGENQLSGSLPAAMGNLTGLIYLDLHQNLFVNSLPTALGKLTGLTELHLDGNRFSGALPDLSGLSKLLILDARDNRLSGAIPASLGRLSSLTYLGLARNQLSSAIPAGLGGLSKLEALDLQGNALSGTIPPALGNLSALTGLLLNDNALTGTIPPELGQLVRLVDLDLSNNRLTGDIPESLGQIATLQKLILSGNQLSGALPSALGSLSALTVLDIQENDLTGTIPAEFSGLTSLLRMDLKANQLEGPVPESLTRLTQLEDDASDFRYNRLFTESDALRSFLNRKQVGGDWESTQNVVNQAPTLTITSIQPRTDGSGRIDIQFIGMDPEGDTVTWYEPQEYCTAIAGPDYDEAAARPLVFVLEDPANTAGSDIVFPATGASFHLVISAEDWASGFYKLRLKVADPADNHSNYEYSAPFHVERETAFTGCAGRDQAVAFPACALEGATGQAVLLRIATLIDEGSQEPGTGTEPSMHGSRIDSTVDSMTGRNARDSTDPALTTLAATYFTMTLDGVSLPMDGKPVLEYNKTAGRWEVAAYHCTGPLTEGSHEVTGTTYRNGVAQGTESCRFTAETPEPYVLEGFHVTYVVEGTGDDTGKLVFAMRHAENGYVTEDVSREIRLHGPDGAEISLSDVRFVSASTRAGAHDETSGAWVYDEEYTTANRYEALFEPPVKTGTYRLKLVDITGRSHEAETTVTGPVVRLPPVSPESFSFEDMADGGLLWRFTVPDTAGTAVHVEAMADLFTGNGHVGTLLLTNPSDPESVILPPDVVSLIRTSGNHARLKVHLATPYNLNHSWSSPYPYPPNKPPAAPVTVYPANGAVIGQTAVRLQASAFSDPDGDAQAASYWRVRERDGDYEDPGLDPSFSGVVREGVMTEYAVSGLTPGVAYVWRVGYQDTGSGKIVWSGESGFLAGQKSQGPALRVGPGVSAGDFQMVSVTRWVVPATAPMVFGPSIGTYDTTRYRIGAYDPSVGDYVEYGDGLNVRPGRAVWFFAREGLDLIVEGIPVSPTTPFRVTLDFNAFSGDGWNQVAPPNEASYDWNQIVVYAREDAGISAVGRLADLADDNPYVDKRLWRWENGAYQSDTTLLEPFKGYWVRARKAGVFLGFGPEAQVSSTGILQTRLIREIRELAGRLAGGPSEAVAAGDEPPAPPAGFTSASTEPESAGGGGGCFLRTIGRK